MSYKELVEILSQLKEEGVKEDSKIMLKDGEDYKEVKDIQVKITLNHGYLIVIK